MTDIRRLLTCLPLSMALATAVTPLVHAMPVQATPAQATPAQATATEGTGSEAAAGAAAQAKLRALYESEWAWRQREYGNVLENGRWVSDGRLGSVAPEVYARRQAYWEDVLAQLDRIPVAQLAREEQVNAQVFRASLEAEVNNIRYRTFEAPFNSDTFFWSWLSPRQPPQNELQYRRLLARMQDIPQHFQQQITNMRAGLARGYSVPRVTIQGRDKTLEAFTVDGPGNPFAVAFASMPANIPEAVRKELQAESARLLSGQVVPAYRTLLAFLREDYMPAARTTISARDLPDGAAFYRSQIREYTTLELTPEQIHRIGLDEVARISAEMRQTMLRAGFEGSFEEFLAFLRSDPQFYAKTPRELLSYTTYVAKRVDGKLKDIFNVLPRYRYTIVPVPGDIAPIYTSGRGGLDACLFNTYDLPSRPLYNLPALTLHECAPGHSHQAAVALEAPDRPDFRRETYFSGYGEGWGLYSEWLGTVMGIYETPYEDFGRLTFEMWRAARLVIDTGLHEYGWTRQQAIDYLASHTALAHHDIETEIDRYISWPGQALAYHLGLLSIRKLRAEAEAELGPAFDQRPFHDAILDLGGVPLTTLEEQMRRFIAEQKNTAP